MKPRQIRTLAQKSDKILFEELARGMQLTRENASRLWSASRAIRQADNLQASCILRIVAEEEEAKYLMLLDAARCNRDNQLRHHLKRFYNHLARGIYARACSWKSSTYGEHIRYVDQERQKFYLDGPNDVDWIFRNSILEEREEVFYVDYIEREDSFTWVSPSDKISQDTLLKLNIPSHAVSLVEMLDKAGYSSAAALEIVSQRWHDIKLDPEVHHAWVRQLMADELGEFDNKGISGTRDPQFINALVWNYTFPLHLADLSEISVSMEDLKEERNRHSLI